MNTPNSPWSSKSVISLYANINKNGTLMPGQKSRCWDWTGSTQTRDQTGNVKLAEDEGKAFAKANRFVWQHFNGEFKEPEAVDVSFACHNPNCCNPDHLMLVSAHNHKLVLVEHSKHGAEPVAPIRRRPAMAA